MAQFHHGAESPYPEQVFFEDADKALGATVAFRGPDKGWGAGDSQKGNLFLEIVRHILAAVVMSQGQALGGLRCEGGEILPHPLFEGFQGRGGVKPLNTFPQFNRNHQLILAYFLQYKFSKIFCFIFRRRPCLESAKMVFTGDSYIVGNYLRRPLGANSI
jgi:hypothetical protein